MNLQQKTPKGVLRAIYKGNREISPGFTLDLRQGNIRRAICDVYYDPDAGKNCVVVYQNINEEPIKNYIEE